MVDTGSDLRTPAFFQKTLNGEKNTIICRMLLNIKEKLRKLKNKAEILMKLQNQKLSMILRSANIVKENSNQMY